jgi:hypothetical protein
MRAKNVQTQVLAETLLLRFDIVFVKLTAEMTFTMNQCHVFVRVPAHGSYTADKPHELQLRV